MEQDLTQIQKNTINFYLTRGYDPQKIAEELNIAFPYVQRHIQDLQSANGLDCKTIACLMQYINPPTTLSD